MTESAARETRDLTIVVLPGDGIGREVMQPCVRLLELAAAGCIDLTFRFETHEAGAEHFLQTGVALPEEVLRAAASADAILLGAMGHPDVRYPNGTEVVP